MPAQAIPQPLRVLLLEDDADDALLLEHELRRAGFMPYVALAATRDEFLARLHPDVDLILCDYNLPQFDAFSALDLLKRAQLDIPLLIVSGTIEEGLAVEALKLGAADYLLKDRLARLGTAVERALQEKRLRQEKEQARLALQQSEARYRVVSEMTSDFAYELRLAPEGTLQLAWITDAVLNITGYAREQLGTANVWRLIIHPEDLPVLEEQFRLALSGSPVTQEFRIVTREGEERWLSHTARPLWDETQLRVIAVMGASRDITEQKRAEAEIRMGEEYLTLALEAARMGIWRRDLQTGRSTWSAKTKEILGIHDADFVGSTESLVHLVYPADRPHVEERINAALTGRDYAAEYRISHPERGLRWIESRGRVYTDDAGRPLHLTGTTTDVTERKEMEQALVKSRAQLAGIIDSAMDAIVSVDADGLIFLFNRAAEVLFGYHQAEALGKPFGLLIPERFHGPDGQDLPSLLEEAEPAHPTGRTRILSGLRRDGEEFPLEFSCSRIEVSGRHLYTVILRDVTARQRYEQGLIEAKERAEEMARLKDNFLMNMSHEIRTPLTSIIGFADLLAEGEAHEMQELVSYIRHGALRLTETLSSVLDLAQLEGKMIRLHLEPFDLGRQTREAMSLFEVLARDKGLSLALTMPEEQMLVVADRRGVARVLHNLLSNAVKFTSEGGVRLVLERDEREVTIAVADTGIGVDPAFLPYLFDEFKQESEGLTRNYEGSGLGLCISKQLVELMGGRIEVESTKGEGSVFRVRLPLHPLPGDGWLVPDMELEAGSSWRSASAPPGV